MKNFKVNLCLIGLITCIVTGCSTVNKEDEIIEENTTSIEVSTESESEQIIETNEEESETSNIEILEKILEERKKDNNDTENNEDTEELNEKVQNPVDVLSGKIVYTDSIDISMYNSVNFIDNNETLNFDYLSILYSTYNDILSIENVYIPIITGSLQSNDSLKYSELDLSIDFYKNELNEILNTFQYRDNIIRVHSATDTDLLNKWNKYYKTIKSIENQLRELNENSSYNELYNTLNDVTANLAEALKIRTKDYEEELKNLENNKFNNEIDIENTEDNYLQDGNQSSTLNIIE